MTKRKKITLSIFAFFVVFLVFIGVDNNRFMRTLPWVISKWQTPLTRDILIKLIDDKDEEVAMWATHNLVSYNDNISTTALLKAINHHTAMVRHNAINAIIFSKRSNLALEQAITLINNPNEETWVIESAIALLGNINDVSKKMVATAELYKFIENKRMINNLSQTDNNAIYYALKSISILEKNTN